MAQETPKELCDDDTCDDHATCLRWTKRNEPGNLYRSLFPYDIPLTDPCYLKIEVVPD